MRRKLISCEVLYREVCAAVARSPHQVDVDYLPLGLHDCGASAMLAALQTAVDRVDAAAYEAVLMGYGMCGDSLAGLTARGLPLVVPRAHDCNSLFLGGGERHVRYFQQNPGAYFATTGWIERGGDPGAATQFRPESGHARMRARYGPENAKFMAEESAKYGDRYCQYTFIEMGIGPEERFMERTRQAALDRGLKFDKVPGDLSLIETLVNGPWDEQRYLTVPPGWHVAPSGDGRIIVAEPASV